MQPNLKPTSEQKKKFSFRFLRKAIVKALSQLPAHEAPVEDQEDFGMQLPIIDQMAIIAVPPHIAVELALGEK